MNEDSQAFISIFFNENDGLNKRQAFTTNIKEVDATIIVKIHEIDTDLETSLQFS